MRLKLMQDDAINEILKLQETSESHFEESEHMLKSCHHSSLMLLNLINDLLDLAKQEKLTFQLNNNFFSLIDAVEATIKQLEFISNVKNIETVLICEPD